MIAATLAGSWRVSDGFAEEDGQARGGRRRAGRGSCTFCHACDKCNGPSSWFFLVCYVTRSGADSRESVHKKVECLMKSMGR